MSKAITLRSKEVVAEQHDLILQVIVHNTTPTQRITMPEIIDWVSGLADTPEIAKPSTISVMVSTSWSAAKGVWAHVYREKIIRNMGGIAFEYWFDASAPARLPVKGQTRWTKKYAVAALEEVFKANPSEVLTTEQILKASGYPSGQKSLRDLMNWVTQNQHVSAVKLHADMFKSTVPRPLIDTGKRTRAAQPGEPLSIVLCEHFTKSRRQTAEGQTDYWCHDCLRVIYPVEVACEHLNQAQYGNGFESICVDCKEINPGEDDHQLELDLFQPVQTIIEDAVIVVQEVPAQTSVPEPVEEDHVAVIADVVTNHYEVVGHDMYDQIILRSPEGHLGRFKRF